MRDATQPHTNAHPIVALGKTLNISFSLEASGELAPPAYDWASDTGDPIVSYYLSPPKLQISSAGSGGNVVLSWNAGAVGSLLQRTFSLTNPDWQVVPGSGTTNQVTWPVETGNAFFRLLAPP